MSILRFMIVNNKFIIKDYEIITIFLIKFFMLFLLYPVPLINIIYNKLKTTLLFKKDIEKIIFQAKPLKQTRYDCISVLVWQKT